ncbi:proton-conducting transporter membrane subunit [Mucilaginibacter sp. 10I4]|uniref:proton-conducting transporter transmembrane domain-containing protein n=1 Tax=Mucilaginibacter sp. 10I4 TaxID=3048580 RepID=UPI002B227707|nr:proton-conducting transporter membrane subunit [Mucilaginibacter sp. 10I4]MEB0262065.1 proton-conducting transporter membrane subunit [Mucilaginibacter sp. 10I4]
MKLKKIVTPNPIPDYEKGFPDLFNRLTTILFSIIFLCNINFLLLNFDHQQWNLWGLLRINGFTLLIWTVVSFFSAVASSYSATYLKGFKYHARFTSLCFGFTIAVMLLVASDHVLLLLMSWVSMGFFMSRLIGVDADWVEAREASRFALKHFLASSILLTMGVLLLTFNSGCYKISDMTALFSNLSSPVMLVSAIFIITAALIQSAIYPFHRWLLSAMTAPTPASALMHAGFVNGSGILLTIFAALLLKTQTLTLLFIVGGITAIIAQFTKLLQTSIKQKLACSTIAQMGFMIMQCGLGFFNAAVVHLILHGFYKAYLFLSSGENIQASVPQKPLPIRIKPLQAVVVTIAGIIGAFIFARLTGKDTSINSGIFLTLMVAITVGQATYNIVKQSALSNKQKVFLPILLFPFGIACYALIYNGVTLLMRDMPDVDVPSSISLIQILFGAVFLAGFFVMKLGVYKKVPWIYVKLLNISQPYTRTILMSKNKSI